MPQDTAGFSRHSLQGISGRKEGSFHRAHSQWGAVPHPPGISPAMTAYNLLVSVRFCLWKSLPFSLFLGKLLFLRPGED